MAVLCAIIIFGKEKEVSRSAPPEIFAHRGAVDQWNEHTIQAYRQSIQDGADWIEIDLRMTKDGVLVPMHDETIERTTTGKGKVEDMTWKELSQFQSVSPKHTAPIPTLEEVFQTFGDLPRYYIETRLVRNRPQMEKELVRLLKKHRLLNSQRVMVQSFDSASLHEMKRLAPNLPFVQLYRTKKFSLKEAIHSPYPTIGLESRHVSQKTVEALHQAGKEIHVFFNQRNREKAEQKRISHFNIDGYFTNNVRYTKALFQR